MSKKKKILKIISINLLLLITIFLAAEINCFIMAYRIHFPEFLQKKSTIDFLVSKYFEDVNRECYDVPNHKMRPIAGKNFKKNPIILFGCSDTYGYELGENENFSGVLSKLTKRPVYNMSGVSWTFAHMLKNLQSNPTIENLNPDYIIYTYINDQRYRMFFIQGWPSDTGLYLRYRIDKNNNLVEVKTDYPFYWRSYLVKSMQVLSQLQAYTNYEKQSKLMLRILQESAKIMKTRYPDAKLIMLLYNENKCEKRIIPTNQYINEEEEKEIKKMGFDIVNIEEEMGYPTCTFEYKVDDFHPSAKFWSEFTPKLIKKYNM